MNMLFPFSHTLMAIAVNAQLEVQKDRLALVLASVSMASVLVTLPQLVMPVNTSAAESQNALVMTIATTLLEDLATMNVVARAIVLMVDAHVLQVFPLNLVAPYHPVEFYLPLLALGTVHSRMESVFAILAFMEGIASSQTASTQMDLSLVSKQNGLKVMNILRRAAMGHLISFLETMIAFATRIGLQNVL